MPVQANPLHTPEAGNGKVREFQKTMSLANLLHLDNGQVVMQADHHIRRAIADCIERPQNAKARTVILQLDFLPRENEHAKARLGVIEISGIDMKAKCKATVPSMQTAAYPMLVVDESGVAVFSPADPDNPLQPGLPFDPGTGEVLDAAAAAAVDPPPPSENPADTDPA